MAALEVPKSGAPVDSSIIEPLSLNTEKEPQHDTHHLAPTEKVADFTSSDSESSYEPEESFRCDSTVSNRSLRPNTLEYKSVYNWPVDPRKGCYLPNEAIKADIISVQKDTERTIHLMNPYIYKLQLEHGPYKWAIEKKYTDFQKLHNRLLVKRATDKLSAPIRRRRRKDNVYEPRTVTTLFADQGTGLIESKSANERQRDPNSTRNFYAEIRINNEALPTVTNDQQQVDENDEQVQNDNIDRSTKRKRRYPKISHFPLLPDSLVQSENIDHRRDELQQYLNSILQRRSLRNHHETTEFLEISRLSFIQNLGSKWKEGQVKKRPGGRLDYRSMKRYFCERCGKWNKRWLLTKDSFVAYLIPRTGEIRDVLLFDHNFTVRCSGFEADGIKQSLSITNMSRELIVKCDSERAASFWKDEITRTLHGPGKQWTQVNRFSSSFPKRENAYAQWFVDGSSFMEHAANMMELACEEIFITDWWLTPEVYLKRPARKGDPWQLTEILRRKAEQGVRVFILVYKELEMALGIGSAYAKRVLMSMHPKILVMRHPEHLPVPWMWAHHEKVIVIDQNIAFVGGIDLCYGRWDHQNHKLADLGDRFAKLGEPTEEPVSELKVITSVLNAEPEPLEEKEEEKAERLAEPMKPERPKGAMHRWRQVAHRVVSQQQGDVDQADTAIGVPLTATKQKKRLESLVDVVFKYQSYLESEKMRMVKSKENTPPMGRKRRFSITKGKLKHFLRRESVDDEIYSEYEKMLAEIEQAQETYERNANGNFWIGKDYVNFIFKDVVGLELPYCDLVDRKAVPRMPWHDISSVVYGEAARDVARHFIQRWNACKSEKLKKIAAYPYLVPKSYENVHIPHIFRRMASKCTAQILRSVGSWSCGINNIEESIHQAYMHLIVTAKHYVYIENQFFVSLIESKDVRNQIARALLGRIVKAHKCGETFRVFVVMPLLPAFEGQLGEPSGAPLQTILHWTYSSISKGPKSLLGQLEAEIGDYSKYITFFALRTCDDLCGRLVTEQVYVHSKMIIADDRRALIGSANINDRSQLGDRDSEVALFVEDQEFIESKMNGEKYEAGAFALSLRKQLFREHLGLLKTDLKEADTVFDLSDPISDPFYTELIDIARTNTDIYDKVFKCYPSDNITTWADLSRYRTEQQEQCLAVRNRTEAERLLAQLRGYLVLLPLKFLKDENLAPQTLSKEGLAPVALFI